MNSPLTDIPVFAIGPCSKTFGSVYGNIDMFFNMANCLSLARSNNAPSIVSSVTGGSNTPVTFQGAASEGGIANRNFLTLTIAAMLAAFGFALTL